MSGVINVVVDLEGTGEVTRLTAVRQFAPDKKVNINQYEVTIKRLTAPPNCPVEFKFAIWHDMDLGMWDFIRKASQRIAYLDSKFADKMTPHFDLIGDAVFAEDTA
ncbi:hypothetical protein SEA_FORZA_49 [Gordonia phage Forza]|uniref:Uncharacterized protein n=1 Tax=Gordonia phage Forza TaxID=2571247 RepID=A0A650FAW6_9CAUD|nr:hypothetical protein PP303_gp049 [Gordonia phage Forza]QEM41519.1 hypothetical protein SEA_BOOPY_50 [Gordonia phage Boopy]QGT55042.1 hypothetical protein SEA_FORZA_49 [Gordonia phage Forza]UXE04192.1 hypothetical protein SEA_BLUENGOLD_48 [Gordonia phage BlueNGold]WBF03831.1 hypothetical protein SEA_MAREELIH_48 [Gordonia phage Mareelih]